MALSQSVENAKTGRRDKMNLWGSTHGFWNATSESKRMSKNLQCISGWKALTAERSLAWSCIQHTAAAVRRWGPSWMQLLSWQYRGIAWVGVFVLAANLNFSQPPFLQLLSVIWGSTRKEEMATSQRYSKACVPNENDMETHPKTLTDPNYEKCSFF